MLHPELKVQPMWLLHRWKWVYPLLGMLLAIFGKVLISLCHQDHLWNETHDYWGNLNQKHWMIAQIAWWHQKFVVAPHNLACLYSSGKADVSVHFVFPHLSTEFAGARVQLILGLVWGTQIFLRGIILLKKML
jgi:hypothetical protein